MMSRQKTNQTLQPEKMKRQLSSSTSSLAEEGTNRFNQKEVNKITTEMFNKVAEYLKGEVLGNVT